MQLSPPHLKSQTEKFRARKSQKGIALMISLFAMIFLMFIATQISYDTQVEYVASAQEIHKLKAFYAARAGMELALFRVLLYQNVRASLDGQIGKNPQLQYLINQIWQFPFAWPPELGDNVSSIDKDTIADTVKESFMDAQFVTSISAEDGKIDLNDLGSDIDVLSQATRDSLLQIFSNKMENDEKFKDKYSNENFVELVNNIADWVDEDSDGRNSSAEGQDYEKPQDSEVQLPPNRAFRTIDELRMVSGMNDDFYDLLKDKVTVYGTKGINPNEADRKVLMSLDPGIDEEVVGKIVERRSSIEKGGPFRDDNDFYGFLESLRVRTDNLVKKNLPLYYNAAYNFRITSIGKSANTTREIKAITFDFTNLSARYNSFMITPTVSPTPGTSGTANLPYKAPKGRPTVVYWEEN